MGNQSTRGFVVKREEQYCKGSTGQLLNNARLEWLSEQNRLNLHSGLLDKRNLLNNECSSKGIDTSSYIVAKSKESEYHINTNTIFPPRYLHKKSNKTFRPQNSSEIQTVENFSTLKNFQKETVDVLQIQSQEMLVKNNICNPRIEKEDSLKGNSVTIENIIVETTSRYLDQQRIKVRSQLNDEQETNHVDVKENEKSNLSEKLSFDVDPGTLRFDSKTTDNGSGVGEEPGWTVMNDIPLKNIRNFSIIAHIDHGKSTLADRLLEMTGALTAKADNKQVLDKLQVEKDRGITVKAQTASLFYKYKGEDYLLNLIDTPGHVDFSNEVARSLAACQGVILLVDANQGVQAQTVANFYLAFGQDLTVLPVLNKIDLKNANIEMCKDQLLNLFSIDPEDVLMISAKSGIYIDTLLEAIIERISPPPGDRSAPMRALIFDTWYDKYRGAVALVYVRDGEIKVGDEIVSAHTKQKYSVKGTGLLRPHEVPTDKLVGGQVGWMFCNMRTVAEAHIGDTIHHSSTSVEPLMGFTPARPMVFAGVYPMDQSEYLDMRNAIEKLALNDPAVSLTQESSPVLGQGWRVGFLGLLHLEVFNQRLEQEYGAEAVMTAPSVPYKVKLATNKAIAEYRGDEVLISDPSKIPEREDIDEISEPMVLGTIITPIEYVAKIIPECIDRRGVQKDLKTIDNNRVMLQFVLPLNEIIVDFHDTIKSMTSGYASFDYEDHGYKPGNLVKLEIRVNGKPVDSLSSVVHKSKVESMGKRLCEKLVKLIPRQMVEVAIQAAVGGKIIARETIKAFKKDVTAKLYGGDRTRKMKLLQKQAEGKKRMKSIANVNIPRDAFIDYLKR
ncbi:translation factor GUF1 homolog, mitochondrial-like [Macrosteles quadrilineatus]|uniref:translation factor GUF1 homolog, mitochondrial-like n=1 Tax=Macrosteles quadrilineatus TaxID=74068 RepID=UPI0023E23E26|nr:translation factor GUF1 homolog, mitochondrial-like [Macrosteles quadrilineatus]